MMDPLSSSNYIVFDFSLSSNLPTASIQIEPWFHYIRNTYSNDIHSAYMEVNSVNQVRANILFHPVYSNLESYVQPIKNNTSNLGILPSDVSHWYPTCGFCNFPEYMDILYEGCGDLKKEYWLCSNVSMLVTNNH